MNYHKDLEQFRVHRFRSKRLKDYCRRMSQDNLGVLVDQHIKDVLVAQGFNIEEAPRSIYKVEKLYQALSSYAPGYNRKINDDENLRHGVQLAYKAFARPKDSDVLHVMPFNPDTIVAITSNMSGSAGLTNYGVTKAQSQTRALERGLQTLHKVKTPEPCIAFKRTQFNDKTRLIWGYPYSMTAIEGLIAKPLLDQFKKGYTPMAFAMYTGPLGTKLVTSSYHKKFAYSLDYSQYDASISSWLIHLAFNILKTWFDLSEIEPISKCKVNDIFRIIERYFINTTIVMPDGNIYIGKNHGVPSGSYFTQIIDSIVNVIIAGAISSKFYLNVSLEDIYVLGDDLLMWSNTKRDLNDISDYVQGAFSLKLHGSEKSKIYRFDEPIHYLGRDWVNGLPTLDVNEVVKRMVYPESFRHYDKDVQKAEYQAKMMMLSYAATYRSAWRVADSFINAGRRLTHHNRGGGTASVEVYSHVNRQDDRMEMYSGLMRFQRRYIFDDSSLAGIPILEMQFWL